MSVATVEILQVGSNDLELLRSISIQTFTETFAHQNTESDMQKYVAEKLSLEQLSKELHTENSSFYFLKFNEQIIGYLKLNTKDAQTEAQGNNCVEIERIYVKQDFQGKDFGKLLMQKAIEFAKQQLYHFIWLAVWEQNFKAIAFYKKQGFVEFGKHTFQLGDDAQIDIMMKLELN